MKLSKKLYMENVVPNLMREGKSPDEAISIASELWAKAEEGPTIEVCSENSIEFSAEVTSTGFSTVVQEEDVLEDMTFAQAFAALKCEPGKRYEIEISVEEV